MTIKVLHLDFWMTDTEMLADCLTGGPYHPVAPRFNRPGIYRAGDQCWFETQTGEAYSYPAETFNYSLDLLEAAQLTQGQADALAAIVKQRLATPAQRKLLRRYLDAVQVRETYRHSRKHVLSTMRQVSA